MKYRLKKGYKTFILVLLTIGVLVCGIYLYLEIFTVKITEVEQPAYAYTYTPVIKYEVYLKPNIIYSNLKMEEEQLYISSLVDYINIEYQNTFKGDREAKISGNYDIVAQVIGYVGGGAERKILWSKDYPLVSKKDFTASTGSLELKEQLKLNIDPYNDFFEQLREEMKLNTTNELVIKMNINYTVEANQGSIKEVFSPSLTIPFGSQFFEIQKTGIDKKDGDLKEKVTKNVPVNYMTVVFCIAAGVILIIFILFTIFAVSEPTEEDRYINMINRIFRSHHNRLVGVDNGIFDGWDHFCKVNSIEDLVKICDEIEKPIMYRYSSHIKDMNEFYVVDNKTIYMYEVKEPENSRKHENGTKQDNSMQKKHMNLGQ